jgi:hypothetical protein
MGAGSESELMHADRRIRQASFANKAETQASFEMINAWISALFRCSSGAAGGSSQSDSDGSDESEPSGDRTAKKTKSENGEDTEQQQSGEDQQQNENTESSSDSETLSIEIPKSYWFSAGFSVSESLTKSVERLFVYKFFKYGNYAAYGLQFYELYQEYSLVNDFKSNVKFSYHCFGSVASAISLRREPIEAIGINTAVVIGDVSLDLSFYTFEKMSYEFSKWFNNQLYQSIGILP